jgi:hypothetical protein
MIGIGSIVCANAAPSNAIRSLSPQTVMTADDQVLNKNESQGILGKKVLSGDGKDMGQIVNVIVDHAGQPRAVVVDFGGFLGVGSRKIAVDWNALHFAPQGKTDQVTLDVTPDQLKAAPEYQEGKPVVVIGPSGGTLPLPAEP